MKSKQSFNRRRTLVIHLALALLIVFVSIVGILLSAHAENIRSAKESETYFSTTLREEVRTYHSALMSSLGQNATLSPERTCYMKAYVGGAWSPPPDELECRITYSQEFRLDNNSPTFFQRAYDTAITQGFKSTARTEERCQSPDFASTYPNDYCLLMVKGADDTGLSTREKMCTLELGTVDVPSGDSVVSYSLNCRRLASKIPRGFVLTSEPTVYAIVRRRSSSVV